MSKIYFYKDRITFDINKESEQIIYKYIRSNWDIDPQLQTKVKDNRIFITNKFGETFAEIGKIID